MRENTNWLVPDLKENLAKADKFEADIVKMVDGSIEMTRLDAPKECLPVLTDGFTTKEMSELDLRL